jgi:hypothetical protein
MISPSMQSFTSTCCKSQLMRRRVNVTWGPKEERLLITGVHTVADIYCTSCNTVLGWKYVSPSAVDVLRFVKFSPVFGIIRVY